MRYNDHSKWLDFLVITRQHMLFFHKTEDGITIASLLHMTACKIIGTTNGD
jgi:hypothetical protein